MPTLQELDERSSVDEGSSGSIDDDDTTLCLCESLGVEYITRAREQWTVQRDNI